MRITTALLTIALTLACQPDEEPDPPSTSVDVDQTIDQLRGAWSLTGIQYVDADGSVTEGTPQESLLYFGPGHYFMGYSHHEERSLVFDDPWNPTAEEALARASDLVVNAGRYEFTDGTLTLLPDFAWYPVVVGSKAIIEPRITGDTLELTYVDQIGAGGESDPYYEQGARYVLRLVRVR